MFTRFLRGRRGSVLPIFAIALLPLLASMGAAVDYSRAFRDRAILQGALDLAVLAAGKKIGSLTNTQLQTEANNFYLANIGSKVANPPVLNTSVVAATITGTTVLSVPTYFLGLVGLNQIIFNMKASATLAMGTIEVALVLDNSTSMDGSKITTLKTAANNLVNTLYGLGTTSTRPDPVKIALVPFGASVNVGSQYSAASWLDTGGKAPYNADAMKANGAASTTNNLSLFSYLKDSSGNAIAWGGCVEERQAPYDVSDEPASTAANPTTEQKKTLFVPMFAPDEPDNWTSSSSCSSSQKTGSGSSLRYNCALSGNRSFNNYLPDAGDATTCGASVTSISRANPGVVTTPSNHGLAVGNEVVFASTGSLPSGLSTGTTYYVKTVPTTMTFTVAATSGGTAIKTTSNGSGTHTYTTNSEWTCANGNANCASGSAGVSEENAFAGQNVASAPLCKYGTASNKKATVQSITVGGFTGGPNYMCTTTPVTPLTTVKTTIVNAINSQIANGYTNITAGLMWGWRLLSPGAPFTEGRSYSVADNQKIIILMTDGSNTYITSTSFLHSLYSAWGYVTQNHLGTTSSNESDVVAKMEGRMALACAGARQAGIKIYTVAFQVTDPTTLGLLSNCASDPSMAYQSSNNAALIAAFTAIGDDISLLRVAE